MANGKPGGLLGFLPQPYRPNRQMPLYSGSDYGWGDEDWGYRNKPTSQVAPITSNAAYHLNTIKFGDPTREDFEKYEVEPFRGYDTITPVGPWTSGYGNRMQEQPYYPENMGYNRPKTYVGGEVVYNKNIDQHIIDDAEYNIGTPRHQLVGEQETTMPWAPQWDQTDY